MSDSLHDARIQLKINRDKAPYTSRWRHVKSGDVYVVKMHVLREDTLAPAVIYYPHLGDPDIVWDRVAEEFFDGRYEQVYEGFR